MQQKRTCPIMSGTTTVMNSCENIDEKGTEDDDPSYKTETKGQSQLKYQINYQ